MLHFFFNEGFPNCVLTLALTHLRKAELEADAGSKPRLNSAPRFILKLLSSSWILIVYIIYFLNRTDPGHWRCIDCIGVCISGVEYCRWILHGTVVFYITLFTFTVFLDDQETELENEDLMLQTFYLEKYINTRDGVPDDLKKKFNRLSKLEKRNHDLGNTILRRTARSISGRSWSIIWTRGGESQSLVPI